jgi:hypothetical protein
MLHAMDILVKVTYRPWLKVSSYASAVYSSLCRITRASTRRNVRARSSPSTISHPLYGRHTHPISTLLSTSGGSSRSLWQGSIPNIVAIVDLRKSGMAFVGRWKIAGAAYLILWYAALSWACRAAPRLADERMAGKLNTDHVRFNSSKKYQDLLYIGGVIACWTFGRVWLMGWPVPWVFETFAESL